MSSSKPERPLGDVLRRFREGEFTPAHAEDAPWHQHTLDSVEPVCTGNPAEVRPEVADRVSLRGMKRSTWERDYLEPWDWKRGPG
jgi:hypothetical protein